MQVPIGISNKHVHLSSDHLTVLFGSKYQLTPLKLITQPGQFAAQETLTVAGPKGKLAQVRILGPTRAQTQVELSLTDARILGVSPPLRNSMSHQDTPGCTLIGPRGQIQLQQGVIIARRHVHLNPAQATHFGVKDGDFVQARVGQERAVIFTQVLVRTGANHEGELHLDTDEGNAAGVTSSDLAQLLK